MGEVGKVIETLGDDVKVVFKRASACSKCKACLLGPEDDEMIIIAKNLCNAKLNDKVKIEIQNQAYARAILFAYVIPLCVLFSGFVLGMRLFDSELLSFIMGIILMFSSYAIIKAIEKRPNTKNMPTATEIINRE